MEIRAKCIYSKDAAKALAHLTVYKKHNPKKTFILRLILCLLLLVAIIAEYIFLEYKPASLIIFVVDVLLIAIDCFMYFVRPKTIYRALAKMQETENEYIFYDNKVRILSKNKEYSGEAEIEYSLFIKVYETSEYLFLYHTKNQVFLVDKSTIENEKEEDIRNAFSYFIKDKYIVCKY